MLTSAPSLMVTPKTSSRSRASRSKPIVSTAEEKPARMAA
jgi:hypothetical protein